MSSYTKNKVFYSVQRAVSDGSLNRIALSIEYLSKDTIKVLVDGVQIPETGAEEYSWYWDGEDIVFNSNIPSGMEVTIQRVTNSGTILNVFSGRAEFSNKTMDENFKQLLFLAQEYSEGSGLSESFNDLDMHGYKIKNVGKATDDADVLTYGQYKEDVQGTYTASQLAKASAESAKAYAEQTASNAEAVQTNTLLVQSAATAVSQQASDVAKNTQIVQEAKDYIQDLVNIEPVKDGLACARVTWKATSDIEAGTAITLPDNVSYVVGRKHIFVSYDGIVASPTFFKEIGDVNTVSKQISLTFPIKTGTELSVWIVPLGTIDNSLYDRVKILEDSLADLSRRVAYATDADDNV